MEETQIQAHFFEFQKGHRKKDEVRGPHTHYLQSLKSSLVPCLPSKNSYMNYFLYCVCTIFLHISIFKFCM